EDIKNRLDEHLNLITYEIQINHYVQTQKEIEAKRNAENAEIKHKIEEKKKAAEAEELHKIELANKAVVDSLIAETFNIDSIKTENAIFPNDFAQMKEIYSPAQIKTDAQGNKIIINKSPYSNEISTIKFNKNGHIISEKRTSNGKTISSTTYEYFKNGSRISTLTNQYGTSIEQEVFNNKGELIAYNYYNPDKKFSRMITYTPSPNGDRLYKTRITKGISDEKIYSIQTTFDEKFEYEFNDDGSIKNEYRYIMANDDGERTIDGKETTEHCNDGSEKIYWNDELKATRINGTTYDINGKELKSYILKNLPSKKDA
ncbi:MAG: hypothetical protein NC200_03665, partial [Candidatus Gastranaerophilales bacterium]|nr:hypothetical protein [Candidatus Gastranaerophilales bacterium]